MVGRVGRVLENGSGPVEAAGVSELFQGGQRAAYDLLGCAYDPLQSLPVCRRATRIPSGDAKGEYACNGS